LGMRHLAHTRTRKDDLAKELELEFVDLETVFRESDVLVLTCPLNEETRDIVNRETLSLMKPSAFIVNVGRGGLIDEVALVDALRNDRIAGAGLDVQRSEPIEDDHPLKTFDNVILTPHSLGITDKGYADVHEYGFEQILRYSRGLVPETLINTDVQSHPRWKEALERFAA